MKTTGFVLGWKFTVFCVPAVVPGFMHSYNSSVWAQVYGHGCLGGWCIKFPSLTIS